MKAAGWRSISRREVEVEKGITKCGTEKKEDSDHRNDDKSQNGENDKSRNNKNGENDESRNDKNGENDKSRNDKNGENDKSRNDKIGGNYDKSRSDKKGVDDVKKGEKGDEIGNYDDTREESKVNVNKNYEEKNDVRTKMPKLTKGNFRSGLGAGYCPKRLSKGSMKLSTPIVPRYGCYQNLLPDHYVMPWRQDMKNRISILANVKEAGEKKLPNIEHNDFLFIKHREQLAPNVENRKRVNKKQTMPPIDKIINPPYYHHLIKNKESQAKAIFPGRPSLQFHHPRLRHVTDCYSCTPDLDD